MVMYFLFGKRDVSGKAIKKSCRNLHSQSVPSPTPILLYNGKNRMRYCDHGCSCATIQESINFFINLSR
jgi:hypothetical protein